MIAPDTHKLYHHTSVLLEESVSILNPLPNGVFVDCTLGGGGHTELLLKKSAPSGRVFAFDRDYIAIENARHRFQREIDSGRLVLINQNFGDIFSVMQRYSQIKSIDGILADIGVSSHHLDAAERGFSFMKDGPLDMRMNQNAGISAAEFIATADENTIADVIYKFGEEPKARFIAKIICERRSNQPFTTTKSLADLIASKVPWKQHSRKHPATKTFQALRIFVNQELAELEKLLTDGPRVLRSGGVLAVITFHSLEDRLAKTSMLKLAGKLTANQPPREIPLTASQLAAKADAVAELISPFPMAPSDDEISTNPRARSAKLRAIRLIKECL